MSTSTHAADNRGRNSVFTVQQSCLVQRHCSRCSACLRSELPAATSFQNWNCCFIWALLLSEDGRRARGQVDYMTSSENRYGFCQKANLGHTVGAGWWRFEDFPVLPFQDALRRIPSYSKVAGPWGWQAVHGRTFGGNLWLWRCCYSHSGYTWEDETQTMGWNPEEELPWR